MKNNLCIGLDFDGVIIDHHENKIVLAKELGYQLLRWQTNTNVMRQFLPHKYAEELAENLYTIYTPSAVPVPGALEAMSVMPKETYIISARTRRSVKFAEDWMVKYKLFDLIPREKIIFCESSYEKRAHCDKLGINIFLDDKTTVLENLSRKIKKVLFDEDGVAERIKIAPDVVLSRSWSEFLSLIQH